MTVFEDFEYVVNRILHKGRRHSQIERGIIRVTGR
jgi:hypothetical protein